MRSKQPHPQQLLDHEVAGEIIKDALKVVPDLDPRMFDALVKATFELKFHKSISIARARELCMLSGEVNHA